MVRHTVIHIFPSGVDLRWWCLLVHTPVSAEPFARRLRLSSHIQSDAAQVLFHGKWHALVRIRLTSFWKENEVPERMALGIFLPFFDKEQPPYAGLWWHEVQEWDKMMNCATVICRSPCHQFRNKTQRSGVSRESWLPQNGPLNGTLQQLTSWCEQQPELEMKGLCIFEMAPVQKS